MVSCVVADAQIIKGGSGTVYDGTDPWVFSGEVSVGTVGTGNTMTVSGGSVVNSQSGSIGVMPGSDGVVTIDGAGSEWTNSSGALVVGNFGQGTLDITNGASVTSASGTVSRIGSSSDMTVSTVNIDGTDSSWDIAGNFVLAGSGTSANSLGFQNAIVNVLNGADLSVGGTLKLWDEASFQFAGGNLDVSTIDLSAPGATDNFSFLGGALSVDNVLGALVQDGGVLSQDGAALTSFDNDYEFNNGTIEIELGGLNRGTEHDAIDVAGIALLNNVTIEVSFIDGFTSSDAALQEFDIFDGLIDSSSTVTFDFTGAQLDSPLVWDTSRFISDGIITAVPEPSSMVVLLAVGGFFVTRRKNAL